MASDVVTAAFGNGRTAPIVESGLLASVAISVETEDGGYRLLRGQRLSQFEADYFVPKRRSVYGPMAEAALVTEDNRAEASPDRFQPQEARTFELELACLTRHTASEAEAILSLFFAEEVAHCLVRLGLRAAQSWRSPTVLELEGPLRDQHAGAFDLRTAGDLGEGFYTQELHVVVAERWLVRLWGEARHYGVADESPRLSLPGSRTRIYAVTPVSGSDGSARLARLIQDVLRHHEWASDVFSMRIEDWERRFFGVYASDRPAERDAAIPDLRVELSRLREFSSAIRLATQTMRRRAGNQPAFPKVVQKEAIDRTEKLSERLDAQRGELRESFALLAGAASEQQARAAQATEARMHSLASLAAYATALVLVPGLIVALYGADISGLPGKGQFEGLLYLALGSLLGAVVTISIFAHRTPLRWTRRGKRRDAISE